MLFTALIVGGNFAVEGIFVDLVHGHPHRTPEDAISMLLLVAPIMGGTAAIESVLVFALPQVFQAAVVAVCGRALGNRSGLALFPALPLTVVLTWYCYDYLTPTNDGLGLSYDPDRTLYEPGISPARFLRALKYQFPVTLFGFLYFELDCRRASKWPLLLATLVLTTASAGIWGYVEAQHAIERIGR